MRRHTLQDATGVLVAIPGLGIMDIIQTTTPTDTDAGYGIGCFWRNTSGTAGTILYVNKGTLASADWLNIC